MAEPTSSPAMNPLPATSHPQTPVSLNAALDMDQTLEGNSTLIEDGSKPKSQVAETDAKRDSGLPSPPLTRPGTTESATRRAKTYSNGSAVANGDAVSKGKEREVTEVMDGTADVTLVGPTSAEPADDETDDSHVPFSPGFFKRVNAIQTKAPSPQPWDLYPPPAHNNLGSPLTRRGTGKSG